jgi:hypothetical protein
MTRRAALDGEWIVECADPEVGFYSDTILHDCAENTEAEPADATTATLADVIVNGAAVVAETIVMRCPVCKATTAYTEHWPAWFFAEPREVAE